MYRVVLVQSRRTSVLRCESAFFPCQSASKRIGAARSQAAEDGKPAASIGAVKLAATAVGFDAFCGGVPVVISGFPECIDWLKMRASAAIVAANSAQKHMLKQQARGRPPGRTFCAPLHFFATRHQGIDMLTSVCSARNLRRVADRYGGKHG